MSLDPWKLAARVTAETGLEFAGSEGRDAEAGRWLELQPVGHPTGQTFALRTVVGWRRIEVHFRPGNFAGDLLADMGSADETGRGGFRAVLAACVEEGADVTFTINGAVRDINDLTIWDEPWRSLSFVIRKGMLAINEGDDVEDARLVGLWTSRAAAAVLALLPVEPEGEEPEEGEPEVIGLPEGAKTRVEVNRYERDRRNRAAALAIHGYACKVCDLELAVRYGLAAAGLIEVHHITPVSEIGPGYIIDPKADLMPLCPNCHSVSHRRSPPYSVEELRRMLRLQTGAKQGGA